MTEPLCWKHCSQSMWNTDNLKIRQQLRACVEKNTLYVQVVEQNIIERIGSWVSHFLGQNRTYAHQLTLVEIGMKSIPNTVCLDVALPKILNSCLKSNEDKKFNSEQVLGSLKKLVDKEIGLKLLDVMLINWQDQLNWINDGLEKVQAFDGREIEKINHTKTALNEAWNILNQQLSKLDPETKQNIDLLLTDQTNKQLSEKQKKANALSEPFQQLLLETINYMHQLYARASKPMPKLDLTLLPPFDKEFITFGTLAVFIGIQKKLIADKEISPELIIKREAYIQELAPLIESIPSMTAQQADKALLTFTRKHIEIIEYVGKTIKKE